MTRLLAESSNFCDTI